MGQQDGDGPSKTRRSFQVGGEETQATRSSKERPIDEVLRLNRDEAPELAEGQRAYNPERIRAFMEGRITLGDLEGITKQEQYRMAEIGFSYLASGKLKEAKTVFEGLLALDPFDAYFHTVLGSIAQQTEDLDEAETRYTRALQINPYSATAMANRGEVRITQGRLTEGAEDLIKAIQADPEGSEQATVRAQATLRVLREKLATMSEGETSASGPTSPTSPTAPTAPAAPTSPTAPTAQTSPTAPPVAPPQSEGTASPVSTSGKPGLRPRPRARGPSASGPGARARRPQPRKK